MKKRTLLALAILVCGSIASYAWDIKDALKGVGQAATSGSTLTNALGNLLSTDKIDVSALEGNWTYAAPAVAFTSDNLLKKAGGAASAAMITGKLEPFYKKAGIDKMTLTIDAQGNFTMKVKNLPLKGTITAISSESSKANFSFNFKASKFNLGKMNAYVEKSIDGKIKLMFDVSKLISLVEKAGSLTGNSTVKTISSALSSYDGMCAGFELKK